MCTRTENYASLICVENIFINVFVGLVFMVFLGDVFLWARWPSEQGYGLGSRGFRCMNERMSENLYIVYKKKLNLACSQCIHVSSHKLKLPKDTHTKKYKQLLPTHPFPKVELYIAVNCKNIYRCTVLLFTERSLYCVSCEATLTKVSAVQSCEVGYNQCVSLLGMTCVSRTCVVVMHCIVLIVVLQHKHTQQQSEEEEENDNNSKTRRRRRRNTFRQQHNNSNKDGAMLEQCLMLRCTVSLKHMLMKLFKIISCLQKS